MKALFFLAHPAHFHLLKYAITHFKNKNHQIVVVIKSKDVLEKLLQENDIPYINTLKTEKKSGSKLNILFHSIKGLVIRDFQLIKIVLKHKPDILVGTDWSIIHVGFLLKKPSIVLNEDDTIATPENRYFYPLAKTLLLPSCCDDGLWLKKRVTYNSYHELAYLHPKNFIPNIEIVKTFNPDLKPYIILRMVNLTASHDVGKMGFNLKIVKEIIRIVGNKMNIYITSEKKLDQSLEKYRISVNPNQIHHALYYAKIFIGDSQTMAAEAGVLGTPFIRFNDFVGKIGYLNELERTYNLGFGFKTDDSGLMLEKVKELIDIPDYKESIKENQMKMLSEKINFSEFLSWFLENYPHSVQVMKENPDYQYNFK